MGAENKAVAYLEINSKQWDDALAAAGKALTVFAVALAGIKVGDFFKEGIENAIKFGNEAYFAAQKLNGYDPGKLFVVQKALQASGLSAQEARQDIEEFAQAGRPLEQMFKGGQAGFADSLTRAAREYGTQAAVLSKSAEEFAYVQMQIDNVSTKLQGFFVGLADKVLPPLSGLISEIDKVDLVGMGEKFGGYIVDAVNTIRGLVANGNLFDVLSAGLKLGFQEAVNYLAGALTSAISVLSQGSLWEGIAQVAIGALAVVGTFLTQMILGIGKLLIATVEAAFEQLRQKYAKYLTAIDPTNSVMAVLAYGGPSASTDVGKNLKNIENGSLIQSQEKGASQIQNTAIQTAAEGLKKLGGIKIEFQKGNVYDTTELASQFQKAIEAANKTGASLATNPGRMNPIFSEKADPFHVIADSLARVGGGGRYIQTGLGIAQKAALDTARNTKQMADYMKLLVKSNSGGSSGALAGAMAGGW